MTQPTAKRSTRARHAATLADVGRAAGVSAMAASAVLNGAKTSSRISDETRQRILEAAEQLRYRPNATARGLAERRMNTLGLATTLSGNELNQYFLEVFNGVIEAAAAAGQNTTVFAFDTWPEVSRRMASICDGRIDGLILLAPLLGPDDAQALPEHTPVVSVHANHALPGVPNIESDEERGAFEMVRQMLALGHRRILHLAGPADSIGANRRVAGWRRAHAEAGVPLNEDLLVRGGFSAEASRRQLADWFDAHRGDEVPHAIFAVSDAVALGCFEVLGARGLQVPRDLSVVGFDDTLLARSARLATVHQPLREMGHLAVRLLLAAVDAKLGLAPPQPIASQVLPTETVLQPSLAPVRPGPLAIP